MVLDDALQKRVRKGKRAKRRGLAVDEDAFPFIVWFMYNKKNMNSWEIAQELFPFIKGMSPRDFDENFSEEARRYLRKVERALKKADKLISSIAPAE